MAATLQVFAPIFGPPELFMNSFGSQSGVEVLSLTAVELISADGLERVRLIGDNFSLGLDGKLNGGTITEVSFRLTSGEVFSKLTGVNLNVTDLLPLIDVLNVDGFYDLIGDIKVLGSESFDALRGGSGNDDIRGGGGIDTLSGFGGDDVLDGGAGGDTLAGGEGFDFATYERAIKGVNADLANTGVSGEANNDEYFGIEGIRGSMKTDKLAGDGNANTLAGLDGDDVLIGRGGADLLQGNAGRDTASYERSKAVVVNLDTKFANGGHATGDVLDSIESLIGSSYNDVLVGEGSSNTLTGGDGNDSLTGLIGRDKLLGGAGDDTLTGGQGIDQLTGSTGKDQFVLDKSDTNYDIIKDFVSGSDKLVISAAAFGGKLAAGVALTAAQLVINTAGHASVDASTRFILDRATGELWYDNNGTTAGGERMIADFAVIPATLLVSDFSII